MTDPARRSEPPTHFTDRLAAAVRKCRTPLVVGLDPRWQQLPEPLRSGPEPNAPQTAADSFRRFCCEVIDVVAPLVPAVKPQAAFFEQLGPLGMVALGEVIAHARRRGLLVIFDGKRNDIGSTAEAYARGILGPGPEGSWQADALTVNPYLGEDSLEPFVGVCRERGAGIFVLVKTSNPGGGMFQDLISEGKPLYRHVADRVEQLAEATCGQCGYGAVGAVVGATYPEQLSDLRAAMPQCWFLVPGFGAQGAGAEDVAGAFDSRGWGAVINSSRAIIFAHARDEYRQQFSAANWQRAVEAATRDTAAQLQAAGIGG